MTKTTETPQTADFEFTNHGSVTLLTPKSDIARDWCAEHLPDDAQRMGAAFAIEPRYAQPILDGIENDGMSVA